MMRVGAICGVHGHLVLHPAQLVVGRSVLRSTISVCAPPLRLCSSSTSVHADARRLHIVKGVRAMSLLRPAGK